MFPDGDMRASKFHRRIFRSVPLLLLRSGSLFFGSFLRISISAYIVLVLNHSVMSSSLDCILTVSSVLRIFQARILQWVGTSLLHGIFLAQRSKVHVLCLLHLLTLSICFG